MAGASRRDITFKGIYITPDQQRAAPYAGSAQRFGAAFVDVILCGYLPLYAFGIITSFIWGEKSDIAGMVIWLGLVAATMLTYLTLGVARGRTVGMFLLGSRVIDPVTGQPPTRRRALVRAVLALCYGVTIFVSMNYIFRDPTPDETQAYHIVAWVAIALAIFGTWSHVWMMFDARSQTALDHIAGVIVIDKYVEVADLLAAAAAEGDDEDKAEPAAESTAAPSAKPHRVPDTTNPRAPGKRKRR